MFLRLFFSGSTSSSSNTSSAGNDPSQEPNSIEEAAHNYLELIGLIVVLYLVFRFLYLILKAVYSAAIAPAIGRTLSWSKLQGWAVVTGPATRIGKEYAKQLAQRGFNVVLIAHEQQWVKAFAEEIESRFHVSTKTVEVDFLDDKNAYSKVQRELEGIQVGVLVNGASVAYDNLEYFSKLKDKGGLCSELVKVNVLATAMMTALVLPQMEERKEGVIINVSSLSALEPTPLLAVYSATKAFVDFLSRALQREYKKKGVIIQTVLPSLIDLTEERETGDKHWRKNTAGSYVAWALSTVGIETRTCAHPLHKLQACGLGFFRAVLPRFIFKYMQMKILQIAKEVLHL